MRTVLVLAAVTFPVTAAPALADKKSDALKRAVDLGPLGEYFELVSVERRFDRARGGTITLRLAAKTDVDTSTMFYKVGFFDKDNHLHLASPLRFDAAFPLKRGESMSVTCGEGRMPQEWYRIAIRKIDKPVPRSEYHYQ